jgi:hypothetical protein
MPTLNGFEPAPFCAAPMPNQKRRLPSLAPKPIPRWQRKPRACRGFELRNLKEKA